MDVAVITACFGGYDTPVDLPPQTVPHRKVLVTDGDGLDGWEVYPSGAAHLHPRMRAKVPKCRPDLFTDADVNIWIDASFRVLDQTFVDWCVRSIGYREIAMIPHPYRNTIAAEADVSAGMTKYAGQPVVEQARHYRTRDYMGAGLWASGLIVSQPSKRVRHLGDIWLREQVRWTYQDQISLPGCLAEAGLEPVMLDGPLYPHPLFTIRAHHRED